jgi:hypothetical protein
MLFHFSFAVLTAWHFELMFLFFVSSEFQDGKLHHWALMGHRFWVALGMSRHFCRSVWARLYRSDLVLIWGVLFFLLLSPICFVFVTCWVTVTPCWARNRRSKFIRTLLSERHGLGQVDDELMFQAIVANLEFRHRMVWWSEKFQLFLDYWFIFFRRQRGRHFSNVTAAELKEKRRETWYLYWRMYLGNQLPPPHALPSDSESS